MQEYGIMLKDLKVIIENNYEGIHLFCPTCGKKMKDLRRKYCSVKCSANSEEVKAMAKKTCIARYGNDTTCHNDLPSVLLTPKLIEEITFPKLNNHKCEIIHYIDSLKDSIGTHNVSFHRERVRKKDPCAILCEAILSYYNFKMTELIFWASKDLNEKVLLCPTCGKRLPDIRNKYCSLKCSPNSSFHSRAEDEISEYLTSILGSDTAIEYNSRSIIPPNEVDIYVPKYQIGIEYDGVLWHSSNFMDKDPKYHLRKTLECKNKGVSLIHIYENEWENKKEIVKSILASRFGKYQRIIYARKCEVKELTNTEYKDFLEKNHIQGYAKASLKLGLYYQGELVSCVGIGMSRFNENKMELIRFCNTVNTKVVGGLSKLLKHSGVKSIISYVDLRYFTGFGYEKIGFKLIKLTKPGYIYVYGTKVFSRQDCQRKNLPIILGDKFNPSLTELENMTKAGYFQLYDCGMLKYELKMETLE